jgi:hypothetical protein
MKRTVTAYHLDFGPFAVESLMKHMHGEAPSLILTNFAHKAFYEQMFEFYGRKESREG